MGHGCGEARQLLEHSDKPQQGSECTRDSGVLPPTPFTPAPSPPALSVLRHYLQVQGFPAGTWGIRPRMAEPLDCCPHPPGPEPVYPPGALSRPQAGPPCSGKQLESCQWVGARSPDRPSPRWTKSSHPYSLSMPWCELETSPWIVLIALKLSAAKCSLMSVLLLQGQ